MFDPRYEPQVQLLLRCLPLVSQHDVFALKGGTAINLFLRDLPRVSVDIDLTYLPLTSRDEALADLGRRLDELGREIERRIPGASIRSVRVDKRLVRLLVSGPGASVKIEPNDVFRGSVFPPEKRDLSPAAASRFEAFVRIQCLSPADLYGSKLCAALDRQHPRDLYDVAPLVDEGAIPPETRRAFVVYLAGHDRPMNELLSPRPKEIRSTFETQFAGKTEVDVSVDDLLHVQEELPRLLRRALDDDDKTFLLSMKRGQPEWSRLGLPHVAQLPALQWKLQNIRRMDPAKHVEALRRLERVLEG